MITSTFEEVFTFEALYRAHLRARTGKRAKKSVVRFEMGALEKIAELHDKLCAGKYKIGRYRSFIVWEPKKREIQTLTYEDRVVQHVLCDDVLAPYFTKRAILDNCVCQKGKGSHFALKRFEQMLQAHIKHYGANGWFVKCDVLKYFPSLPHEKLKKAICGQISDRKLRDYVSYVIDSFHTSPAFLAKYGIRPLGAGDKTERGIPIGNQSSQIFGMYFLDPVDRLVKEKLRVKAYSRYMDDMVAVCADESSARRLLEELKKAAKELELSFNCKSQIFPLKNGVTYLGYRFFVTPGGKIVKTVKKATKRRLRSRTKLLEKACIEGYIGAERVQSSVAAFHGHLKHGNNVRFERELGAKLSPLLQSENPEG